RPHGGLGLELPEDAEDLARALEIALIGVTPPVYEHRFPTPIARLAERERREAPKLRVIAREQLGDERRALSEPRERERGPRLGLGVLFTAERQPERGRRRRFLQLEQHLRGFAAY